MHMRSQDIPRIEFKPSGRCNDSERRKKFKACSERLDTYINQLINFLKTIYDQYEHYWMYLAPPKNKIQHANLCLAKLLTTILRILNDFGIIGMVSEKYSNKNSSHHLFNGTIGLIFILVRIIRDSNEKQFYLSKTLV